MNSPTITFIQDTHTYLVNGELYISVTQLLQKVGIIEHWLFSPGSADRGKEIHKITEMIDRGSVILPPNIENGAYRRFLRETSVQIKEIEKIVVHHPFKYAGTIDRIAELEGRPAIVDIKTGQVQDWHGIQLAANKLALGNGDPRLYGLYLRKNGKYYLKDYSAKYYAEIFLTALKAYHWRARGKGIDDR